ncbi:MAG: type II toxin-antitoxin system VapC family toxin [Rhodoblastus sp.]
MRLLLDTHIAIWSLTDPDMLSSRVRALLSDPDNDVYISAASIWEIAIKHALGKRAGAPPFGAQEAIGVFSEVGYDFLAVSPDHAAAVETLPMHHADPFDRLLVAQALIEPMRLVTADPMVARYSDTTIRA